MATGALTEKDEFRNTSTGWIGVVLIDGRGDHRGFPVAPGDSIWLSEEEQIATANAPRDDKDNPFLASEHIVFDDTGAEIDRVTRPTLELVTKGAEVRNRRPYGAVTNPVAAPAPVVADAEETGAAPEPDAEPELGSNAPGEEVGTPQARRRRAPAKAG